MSETDPRNLAQSVLDRLRTLSRERGEDFNLLLTRYAGERLLHRISQSEFRDRFVLKGAMLFVVWTGRAHRPTRDVDLLGLGEPSAGAVTDVFRSICDVDVEPDAVELDPATIEAAAIRDAQAYGGIRVRMKAKIGTAIVRLQIDVGFGDVITPGTIEVTIDSVLGLPATTIAAYPPETVVAEKLEAIVKLGIANSRMKDFYDLWVLSDECAFEFESLEAAVQATFQRRNTSIPASLPIGLTDEFATDELKLRQWNAFLYVHGFAGPKPTLAEVIDRLRSFVGPPIGLIQAPGPNWMPGGPW